MKTTELQQIPGVGKSIAKDLVDLGFSTISDLKDQNPQSMYQHLCALREQHIDRCVLYVFRTAVYYASRKIHDPKKLKWWNWKDEE